MSLNATIDFSGVPYTIQGYSYSEVLLYDGYTYSRITLANLANSLSSYMPQPVPPAPPAPSPSPDLSAVADVDLIMTALSRGYIIQKQP